LPTPVGPVINSPSARSIQEPLGELLEERAVDAARVLL